MVREFVNHKKSDNVTTNKNNVATRYTAGLDLDKNPKRDVDHRNRGRQYVHHMFRFRER
jgi:hypothetical protein